jgi:hypothetical protein
MKELWVLVALAACQMSALATALSPNALGHTGDIPGTYSSVTFSTADGNHAPRITLPASAAPNAEVIILHGATYNSELATANTDLPLPSITLQRNDRVRFVFDAGQHRWTYAPATIGSPNTVGTTVRLEPHDKISAYSMADGNWAPTIDLPASAPDGALVLVRSAASYLSHISSTQLQYASTNSLRKGDAYLLRYRADLGHWVSLATPTQTLQGNQNNATLTLGRPVLPLTQVTLSEDAWNPQIDMPASAGDRDRVNITSTAHRDAAILNKHVDYQGSMHLQAGMTYSFMFIKELGKWVLQSWPRQTASDPGTGGTVYVLPAQDTPVMDYERRASNAPGSVVLPNVALEGDRVIIHNTSSTPVKVLGTANSAPLASMVTQDMHRFAMRRGAWTQETRQITMLQVYSDRAATALGDAAMRLRLDESLRLTNQALENSGVNFYVKSVGQFRYQIPNTTTIAQNLGRALAETAIANKREEWGADVVYYADAAEGCGVANLNGKRQNMVATENIACGTTVMRHEFGHTMGLTHCASDPEPTGYAHGNRLTADVMCGNKIPYYSTPTLYSKDIGLPLGEVNKTDAVRRLNERSAEVSAYHNSPAPEPARTYVH